MTIKDKSYNNCLLISKIIQEDLMSAGLSINFKKSMLLPSQLGKWLGFLIDTKSETIKVPPEKIDKLKTKIIKALNKPSNTARDISKIAGTIISMSIAIGPPTRIFTRKLFQFIEEQNFWDKKVLLSEGASQDLNFWKNNLDSLNGYRIKSNHLTTKISCFPQVYGKKKKA